MYLQSASPARQAGHKMGTVPDLQTVCYQRQQMPHIPDNSKQSSVL